MIRKKSFLDVVTSRRSVRRFSQKEVPHSLIHKILELATYAPTNCNQQLWSFVVITDQAMKERLVREAATSTILPRAPVAIAVSYDGWNRKEALQGASLAVQNILLAATYYGIGALSMNSYGADTTVKKILHIPSSHIICCFVLLGHADNVYEKTPPVPRRPVDEVLHWNHFQPKQWMTPSNSYDPERWTLESLKNFQKYYCRKTFLGKEMDIYHPFEKELARRAVSNLRGTIADYFTYDGAFLDVFPKECNIRCYDLTPETSGYSKAAAASKQCPANIKEFLVWKETRQDYPRIDGATLLYKAERVPSGILKDALNHAKSCLNDGGKIIIVARRNSILYSAFYRLIKTLFGDDTRKTGIYAFFGPYAPVRTSNIVRILRELRFSNITTTEHCIIPPFFDQAYQMFLQYRKSEGTTYLHRVRIETPLTKFLSWIIKKQGLSKSSFGSITIITAEQCSGFGDD